jgi:DNA-binding LacI/PurR family transcriptional regulator
MNQPDSDDVYGILNGLFGHQVDGVIWAIPQVAGNLEWSHQRGSHLPVPVVLVGGMAGQTTLPWLGIDNRAIGRLATQHLIAGGARRIGLITGPRSWWEAQEREAGWRETVTADGPDTRGPVFEGDWTAASGEAGLRRLLEADPDLDAVFASNDQMALGVLHAAHSLGRRVPHDLSVVGVDNIAEGSHYLPPLTTVHQPLRDVGMLAVDALAETIRRLADRRDRSDPPGLPEPQATLLQPELIVRESSRVRRR